MTIKGKSGSKAIWDDIKTLVETIDKNVISVVKDVNKMNSFVIGQSKCWGENLSGVEEDFKKILNYCSTTLKPLKTLREFYKKEFGNDDVFNVPCNIIKTTLMFTTKCHPGKYVDQKIKRIIERLGVSSLVNDMNKKWEASGIDEILAKRGGQTSFLEDYSTITDNQVSSQVVSSACLLDLKTISYSSVGSAYSGIINFLNNQVNRLAMSRYIILSLSRMIKVALGILTMVAALIDLTVTSMTRAFIPMTDFSFPITEAVLDIGTLGATKYRSQIRDFGDIVSYWLDYSVIDSNNCIRSFQTLLQRKSIDNMVNEDSFDTNTYKSEMIKMAKSMGKEITISK
jgi:hypothetical protein